MHKLVKNGGLPLNQRFKSVLFLESSSNDDPRTGSFHGCWCFFAWLFVSCFRRVLYFISPIMFLFVRLLSGSSKVGMFHYSFLRRNLTSVRRDTLTPMTSKSVVLISWIKCSGFSSAYSRFDKFPTRISFVIQIHWIVTSLCRLSFRAAFIVTADKYCYLLIENYFHKLCILMMEPTIQLHRF